MANIHPVLIGVITLIVSWLVIFTIVSRASGWAALAEQYRSQETFTGKYWSFQRGHMRYLMGYNNCLNVGGDQRGLYLAITFPFVFIIGHPPLFIPWHDISYVHKKVLWTRCVELHLGPNLQIPLQISPSLAERLKATAGSNWPNEGIA